MTTREEDEVFMRAALDLAITAAGHDDVPVGCVLVSGGAVIAVGENRRERDNDPTAHAEIVALRHAAARRASWRMDDVTAYVTLEPCVMCAGALLNARVSRVVVGAMDEKAGGVGSRYNLLSDPRLLHEASLRYGVLAAESAELLRTFFVERRHLVVALDGAANRSELESKRSADATATGIELICFDMAGTTMVDDGLVLEAFRRTIEESGVSREESVAAEAYVIETMGQSKMEVFTAIFGDDATSATESFEHHFIATARESGVHEIPGARTVIEALRDSGRRVALTTGFSRATREALIEILGWADLFDVRVSPSDAGRGRPAPDMLWWCALRLSVRSADSLMVVGDTASDMVAGRRAGAGYCVGVLSGTDGERRLIENGAQVVIGSVASVMDLDVLKP